MIKENQKVFNNLHIITDGIILFISMIISYRIRFFWFTGFSSFSFDQYLTFSLFASVLCLFSFGVFGIYQSYRNIRLYKEAQNLFIIMCLNALLLMASLYIIHLSDMSRWMIVVFSGISYFFLMLKRTIVRKSLQHLRKLGYNQKHVVVVGSGDNAKKYVECLHANPNMGFVIDGYFSNSDNLTQEKYMGGYKDLNSYLSSNVPDEVIVAISSDEYNEIGKIINICEKCGAKLSLIPFYADYISSNPQIDNVEGIPLINLRRIPLDNFLNAFVKRFLDVIGSFILLVLTSPIMLITAIGVKLSSPGPIIFSQKRVGKDQREFNMYKFRSMKVNSEEETGWSTQTDTRRTKFGSFIRKYSIDEFPQFWNVFIGDMSLVGPRPEVPYFVEKFKEEIPKYMVKHQVRPGITGWAQVCGYRGDTSIKKRIEHDIYYIENWNLFFDLKILLMTIFKFKNEETY